ncbi:MAG: STAS domain-containing protein [Methylohalobius sp.]|nr:STAS domain-containing protein [Methylohalobius sp.]
MKSEAVSLHEIAPGHIRVNGELSFATTACLWRASKRLFAKIQGDVVIDLSGVPRADSAGLALLVEWLRQAKRQNKRLTLINFPKQVLAMAQAYGLDVLLSDHG